MLTSVDNAMTALHMLLLVLAMLSLSEGVLVALSHPRLIVVMGILWLAVALLIDAVYVPLTVSYSSAARVVWTVGMLHAHLAASWYITARYVLHSLQGRCASTHAISVAVLFLAVPSLLHCAFLLLVYG